MTSQAGSTRQVALDEITKFSRWSELIGTVEVQLPSEFDKSSRDDREEALTRPKPLSPVSVDVDSRSTTTEQLRQMEQRLNKRAGMQFQYLKAARSEIQFLRWILMANTVLLGSLLILMWR